MTEKLADIPSLDQLAANHGLVPALPGSVVQHMLIQVTSLLPILVANVSRGSTTQADGPATPETFLTVDQAVKKFAVTRSWLYRHKKQLPHSQPSRKVLLFPESRLQKWFASRKGV